MADPYFPPYTLNVPNPAIPVPDNPPGQIDYELLSNMVSTKVVDQVTTTVADRVSERVANLVAPSDAQSPGPVRNRRKKKRKERCNPIQVRK